MHLASKGHPDMIIYLPKATTLFIEIKAENDFLSEWQMDYIAYLEKCEHNIITASSVEDVFHWLHAHGFVFGEF